MRRTVINPSGVLVAVFIGAIVLLFGGSWPLAIVVGLGFVPALVVLLDVLIWALHSRLRRRIRKRRQDTASRRGAGGGSDPRRYG